MAREKPVFLTLRNHSYRDYRESSKFRFSNSLHFKSYDPFKDIYFVIYGIISEFTDKGQFHYLTKLKGPQVGNYLYTTQFLLLR